MSKLKINKQIASAYIMQLELISIIFFIIKDNTTYFSDADRRRHKLCLKGAQRYLPILQGLKNNNAKNRHGTLPATVISLSYWQTRKDLIIETRNIKTINSI